MSIPSASPDPMITQQPPRACTSGLAKNKKPFGVAQPCEDDSADAEAYTKELIAAVEAADAAIDRGEFITLEELEKEFYSWCAK